MYSNKQRRVPGVVVLASMVILVGGLIGLFGREKAPVATQDSSILERVDIANIRDKSFTVYWRTEEPTEGYLVFGSHAETVNRPLYDDRDKSTDLQRRHNHVVHVTNISQDSEVFFRIVVDGEYVGQSSELPFSARTGLALKKPLDIDPIYGKIEGREGDSVRNAVVVLNIGNSKPLLTQTNNDGTFLFSPCCIYNLQSGEIMYPSQDEKIRLEIIAESGTSKIVQAKLEQVSPLAQSILLDGGETVVADVKDVAQNDSNPEVLAVSDSVIKFDPVDIIYPLKNASIPGVRPLIKGVGEPGNLVKGWLEPANRIFQVRVDQNRTWQYSPSFDFSPGLHQLRVETADAQGKLLTLTRSFTILKSGEAVLQAATPSGTITPTETVTPTEETTPTPTTEVTVTPTVSSTPPVTGINIVPFSIISLVLIGIGAGIVLLF